MISTPILSVGKRPDGEILYIGGGVDGWVSNKVLPGFQTVKFGGNWFAVPEWWTIQKLEDSEYLTEKEVSLSIYSNDQLLAGVFRKIARRLIREWCDPRTFIITTDAYDDTVIMHISGLKFTKNPGPSDDS